MCDKGQQGQGVCTDIPCGMRAKAAHSIQKLNYYIRGYCHNIMTQAMIGVSKELKAKIKRLAEHNVRPINWQLELLVDAEMKRLGL